MEPDFYLEEIRSGEIKDEMRMVAEFDKCCIYDFTISGCSYGGCLYFSYCQATNLLVDNVETRNLDFFYSSIYSSKFKGLRLVNPHEDEIESPCNFMRYTNVLDTVFEDSSLSHLLFEFGNIKNVTFKRCELKDVRFHLCYVEGLTFEDCEVDEKAILDSLEHNANHVQRVVFKRGEETRECDVGGLTKLLGAIK